MEEKNKSYQSGKSMNVLRHPLMKAAAMAVLLISVLAGVILIWDKAGDEIDLDAAMSSTYQEDWELKSEFLDYFHFLSRDAFIYNTDGNVKKLSRVKKGTDTLVYNIYMNWLENGKSGEPVIYQKQDGEMVYYFYPGSTGNSTNPARPGDKAAGPESDNGEAEGAYDTAEKYLNQNEVESYHEENNHFDAPANLKDDKGVQEFLKQYPHFYDKVEQIVQNQVKEEYQENKDLIEKIKGNQEYDLHYSQKNSNEDKKLIEQYRKYPMYIIYYPDEDLLETSHDKLAARILYQMMEPDEFVQEENRKTKGLLLGVPSQVFSEREAEWEKDHREVKDLIQNLLICLAFALFAFFYLCAVTGRSVKDEEVHLYRLDRLWSEITWGLFAWLLFAFVFCLLIPIDSYYESIGLKDIKEIPVLWLFIGGCAASALAIVELLLSQIRHLKAKDFWNSFLLIRLWKKGWGMLKRGNHYLFSLWRGSSISRRALILAIAIPLISMTWIGVLAIIPLLIAGIYKYMGDFKAVLEGTERIRNGELEHKIIVVNKNTDLHILAENINEISQGLENAVAGEIRSERLKTELITNVSHDLKTPLTSIITYVDLVKKEPIENQKAVEYIEVIDRKAQRLSVLTNDLFDAAKASSGDMPVHKERVDLNAILRQALGEYGERMEKSELIVRLTLPEHPVYVFADGRLTWRVISNLLSNVCKYALTGSRVYIDVDDSQGEEVSFTIKNVSSYELNIPADELMERFKRADSSRNTEGSGLGLNIANSLMELQKGEFFVEVDGDLFKAICKLNKYKL